jgi:hypothetical protein
MFIRYLDGHFYLTATPPGREESFTQSKEDIPA